jgi:RNA polymerase sigma-70 factor (ECF subfamily)
MAHLALLDPDVVLRADQAAVAAGASAEVRGATAIAEPFSGLARAPQPAVISLIADPERVRQLNLEILANNAT